MLPWTGNPEPLGPSKISESAKSGVNFALYSEHATAITLLLSDMDDKNVVEIHLDAAVHRSGNVWHAAVEGCPLSGVLYGYKVEGTTGWEVGDRC
jgi:pullulanase/glycogen debranching enzyme